eukprot:3341051-Prymnesium_polylepis.3
MSFGNSSRHVLQQAEGAFEARAAENIGDGLCGSRCVGLNRALAARRALGTFELVGAVDSSIGAAADIDRGVGEAVVATLYRQRCERDAGLGTLDRGIIPGPLACLVVLIEARFAHAVGELCLADPGVGDRIERARLAGSVAALPCIWVERVSPTCCLLVAARSRKEPRVGDGALCCGGEACRRLHDVVAVSSWYVPRTHAEHSPSPPVCAIVPAAQAVCCTLPVGAKKPGSVGVHCAALVRLVALENEPCLHGSAADAPRGQKEPPSHLLHLVALGDDWYVPPAHLSHSLAPGAGATVPGEQGVGSADPLAHALPGGHSEHCAASDRPLALEKRPAAHASPAVLPATQKLPRLHGSGCVVATLQV